MGQQGQYYIKSLGKVLHGVGPQKWGSPLPHCTSEFQFSVEWKRLLTEALKA